MRRLPLFVLALFVFLAPLASRGEKPWIQAGSDVPADPSVLWGQLPNGLRYAVMPRANPPGNVSLRLVIDAGSLDETDGQRGLAHFVEHMAFNGTRHYRRGELVRYFERHGMGFGDDATANTYPDCTVYRLDLTDNTQTSVDDALGILRDFADGVLFDRSAVDRERGVILAESRFRRDRQYRKSQAMMRACYQGTLAPERLPIGQESVIERADPAALRAFYDAWYRPERMVLLVVGEISPSQLAARIAATFGSLKDRGAAPVAPAFGALAPTAPGQPAYALHTDPEEEGVGLLLESVSPLPEATESRQARLHRMTVALAGFMLSERLETLRVGKDPAIAVVRVSLAESDARRFVVDSISIGTSVRKWKDALDELETARRTAAEQGFLPDEVQRTKVSFTRFLEERERSAQGRLSREIADEMADCLRGRRVFTTPAEDLAEWKTLESALSPDDLRKAFAERWQGARCVLMRSSSTAYGVDQAALREAYAEATQRPLPQKREESAVEFPYRDFGPVGAVAQRTHHEAADDWEVDYANGVRLFFHRNTAQKNSVALSVRFGDGVRGEPKDLPGIRQWVPWWLFGGLGRVPFVQLRRILAVHPGDISCAALEDAFSLSIQCPDTEAPFYASLAAAYFTDPAFDPGAEPMVRQSIDAYYNNAWSRFDGIINECIRPALAGGDVRYGQARKEQLSNDSLPAFRAWFEPRLRDDAIDVFIAGDLTREKAEEIVARTFGALPARARNEVANGRCFALPSKAVNFTYNWSNSLAAGRLLQVYWPVDTPLSADNEVRLGLLMAVFNDRLRVALRERLGKTYVQGANVEVNRGYGDFAWLVCSVECDASSESEIASATQAVVNKLAKGRISGDELERARSVFVAAESSHRVENEAWCDLLFSASRYKAGRDYLDRAAELARATRVTDLISLAHHYFRRDPLAVYHIHPQPPVAPPPAPAGAPIGAVKD